MLLTKGEHTASGGSGPMLGPAWGSIFYLKVSSPWCLPCPSHGSGNDISFEKGRAVRYVYARETFQKHVADDVRRSSLSQLRGLVK